MALVTGMTAAEIEELLGPLVLSGQVDPVTHHLLLTTAAGGVIDAGQVSSGPGGPGDPGPSAYEVAVANGFVGSEPAWLASLVGPQGPQGLKGDKGDKGDAGTGSTGIRFADLPTPIVLAHRGAGDNLAPRNTMDAFRIGASYGPGVIDGGDWRLTSDGALITIHDPTIDNVTDRTGNVSDLSSAAIRTVKVDASQWFGGNFPDTVLPTAEMIYSEIGGTVVLSPEPKILEAAQPLANLIARLGLQDAVFPTAFTSSWLDPFIAIGCKDVLLNVTTMPDATTRAALLAQGVKWIGIPFDGTITTANVTTLVNAGFKVMVGTTALARDATAWSSVMNQISMWVSDEPLYFAHALNPANATRYRRSTDPYATGTFYHGHVTNAPNAVPGSRYRGSFLGSNRWGFQVTDAAAGKNPWVLQGWACPLPNPAAYTVDFSIAFDALGSATGRWPGQFWCCPTDDVYENAGATTDKGYQTWMTVAGTLNIAKQLAGVSQPTTSVSTGAVGAPVTTSAAIAAGVAITSIPVTALATALAAGANIALPGGNLAVVGAAGAAAGATSIPIASVTPLLAIPSGTQLPRSVPFRFTVTSTTVTIKRVDTNQSVSLTDNAYRGPYFMFGMNDSSGTTGLHVSYHRVTVT